MMNLTDAEILVDTVFSMESGAGNSNWFALADYGSMEEFQIDCDEWFSEPTPEYVYLEWWGIPDTLIRRDWLCPNVFEIRDAVQMLDDDSLDGFEGWCRNNGHDLATDDPHMLVTRFQDCVPPSYDPGLNTMEQDNEPCAVLPENLLDLLGLGFGPTEIFDDNYN